jgi:mono/diheme cytochrome c family protein
MTRPLFKRRAELIASLTTSRGDNQGTIMTGSARLAALIATLFLQSGVLAGVVNAADWQVERGKYLLNIIPCTDCHTPGTFFGKPDMSRYLSGSEVGFEVPGLGVFYGSNLTPDKETGLGNWTKEQIAVSIRTGKRPDGRMLVRPMPSDWFHHLTEADALAIAAYLKSLPQIKNKVPGPFGPNQKPTSFVLQVLPPDKYTPTPPPPGK